MKIQGLLPRPTTSKFEISIKDYYFFVEHETKFAKIRFSESINKIMLLFVTCITPNIAAFLVLASSELIVGARFPGLPSWCAASKFKRN